MSGRVWLGLLFLVFGVGFFMHQADIIDFIQLLSMWWPLIFIIIGIIQLLNRTYSSVISGLLFLFVGIIFLVNPLFDMNIIVYLWPLIFIIIGLIIIFTRIKREKTSHVGEDINTFAIFSGAEINSQSRDFKGGSITTIFGGAEIDLREAVIAEGALLDLTSVFGGVTLFVSENVHVEVSGIPIFSGWEDKTRQRSENGEDTVLKINCLTILSGVEIKN